MVFGDSVVVVQQINKAKKSTCLDYSPLLQRIILINSKFEPLELFHVYRHLNSMAEAFEKKNRSIVGQGRVEMDSCFINSPIP